MKNPFLISALALTLLTAGATAADKKDPVVKSSSTATQTQIVTRDGKTAGTVTLTINNNGETQVKTWKVGDPFQATALKPTAVQPKSKMEKVAWLGVAITEVSEDLVSQLPISRGAGVRVRQVIAKSPAAKAGIRTDDLIYKLDEQIIFNIPQFQALVRSYQAGSEMKVTLFRKGKKQTVTAKPVIQELLIEAPATAPLRFTAPKASGQPGWRPAPPNPTVSPKYIPEAPGDNVQKHHAEQRRKIPQWIQPNLGSRAYIVRPDGKTTYVRDAARLQDEIRSQVEEALKKSALPEAALKTALKALEQSFQNQKKIPPVKPAQD